MPFSTCLAPSLLSLLATMNKVVCIPNRGSLVPGYRRENKLYRQVITYACSLLLSGDYLGTVQGVHLSFHLIQNLVKAENSIYSLKIL